MERDLAKHVVIVGFKAMHDLTDLLELLKARCDPTEYAGYAHGVSVVSGEIVRQILNKAFSNHPDLEPEMDAKVKKYGKLIRIHPGRDVLAAVVERSLRDWPRWCTGGKQAGCDRRGSTPLVS